MELSHFDRIIAERDSLKAERDTLAQDLSDAASDFPVALPEPGSDMAKVITANRLLRVERDDLARQLGDITAVVAACKHIPQRDTIAETISAADDRIGAFASSSPHPIAEVMGEEFKALASHVGIGKRYEEASRQRVTPMSPRALASIIKDWCYRRAKLEAAQARQEALREVAKALGAEEAFEAMEATRGPSGVTPDGLAGAVRIALGLTKPRASITSIHLSALIPGFVTEQNGDTFKVVGLADPFAGIMDGPEMMPLGDDEGDQ